MFEYWTVHSDKYKLQAWDEVNRKLIKNIARNELVCSLRPVDMNWSEKVFHLVHN